MKNHSQRARTAVRETGTPTRYHTFRFAFGARRTGLNTNGSSWQRRYRFCARPVRSRTDSKPQPEVCVGMHLARQGVYRKHRSNPEKAAGLPGLAPFLAAGTARVRSEVCVVDGHEDAPAFP